MRYILLLICTLVAVGLLYVFGNTIQSSNSYYDMTAFREDRMRLPEKQETLCLEPKEDIKSFRNGSSPEEMFYDTKSIPKYRLEKIQNFDLDENGIIEEFALRNGNVTIKTDSHIIWRSPNNWWIDYFFLGDTNNDGTSELNLLVWKEGSFGSHKPFWIEKEDTEVKNHFFIFKLEKGQMKPVWQSSNLDQPNYCGASIDFNDDGENELITIEGSYNVNDKRQVTMWKWDGWGFSRISFGE